MAKFRIAVGAFFVSLMIFVTSSFAGPRTIYLVPIAQFDAISMKGLKIFYHDRFGIDVQALPLLPFEQATYDAARQQLIAEELIEQIKRGYPTQAQDGDAILIGLTDGDMYIREEEWRFGFNYRADDRFAVVACARMDPVNFGQPADKALLASRARKMLTKNIGIMYFKKDTNDNPKSVLYNNILSLDDLDHMGEDF